MPSTRFLAAAIAVPLVIGAAGCGSNTGSTGTGAELTGTVTIDGSSTVFPFAQAAAELFQRKNPGVKITVGQSGTGGGFEKFCRGETDISDASRQIKQEEIAECDRNGVRYEEVQVASDGVAIVTNPALSIKCVTTAQLKKLWEKGSTVTNYKQVSGSFPDSKVSLFGPGTDSGTFDFYTATINGQEGNSRSDYQASEDDNVLVQGVEGDKEALAYFGFSYYDQNRDRLNLVAVNDGSGCVSPDVAKIQSGEYKPLSRPVLMYPSAEQLQRPQVKAFMDYVLKNYNEIAHAAQIVPMSAQEAAASARKLATDTAEGTGTNG